MFKKVTAEFIGTFVLTLFGTGTAVLGGGKEGIGILGISMAFGLSIVAMAYSIGIVSGCHVNPAVSVAMYINKKLNLKELLYYIVSQVLGAIAGTYTLIIFLNSSNLTLDKLGQNEIGALTVGGAFFVEVILTFVFILVILMVTSKKGNKDIAGLAIGFTLVLVHLIGIPLTGTSVNPARSIGPAIFAGGDALNQLWIFIAAPTIGGILAALVSKYILETE